MLTLRASNSDIYLVIVMVVVFIVLLVFIFGFFSNPNGMIKSNKWQPNLNRAKSLRMKEKVLIFNNYFASLIGKIVWLFTNKRK